jgi:nucleoside-diphosphate-sugar epimerase
MAQCYSKLYNIPSTGLRFFTVYGPAGRPDMAYFGFTNKLLKGETIQIFNYGNCRRDFTYVDDIVEGVVRVMAKAPEKKTNDGITELWNHGNTEVRTHETTETRNHGKSPWILMRQESSKAN